ncbi:hypothetical protein [Candidatus Magnetobacterium casense]|uniref:Secreted protein n=1 Tax=Candidatus Magnetobacterium casense TaxID=1455061 RepID=A0ABS6S1Y8_9BACT|nr:hypothetical protein [Candidatus Magnetobacterium casensis]MBV6342855.1 hypothetical protein [Candidatus Magnetobacterium casensis]
MTKVILAIVGLVLGLMLVANVLPDVVDDVAADDYSENFVCATAANVTSANETLSYAHYYEDLTDLAVDSDNGADTPVILAYDEDDYIVTVGGLAASDTRILTIDYVREAHQEFTGFAAFVRLLPFITVIGLFVTAIWGLFSAWKSRG